MFVRVMLIAMTAMLACALGCEKTDHESIDKWSRQQSGPAKLRKALVDEAVAGDLAAHAAANLIRRGEDQAVYPAFGTMSPGRRADVVAKLAPRVWDAARVESERDLPGPPQVAAKDALVRIRTWADEPSRRAIDKYLIDWYCVASYEDRAKSGANLGASVLRIIGPAAAPKLMSVANGVIAAPGQDKVKNRIGDELLLGLAVTGSSDAAKYVLDIAKMDRGDATLSRRALSALFKAYVDPDGQFEAAAPDGLVPNLPAIVEIARDDAQDGRVANDAVALIRAAGAPACLSPLLGMIGAPHRNADFKVVAATNALKCGGAPAIVDVVQALPDAGAYTKDQVGGIARTIAAMTPAEQVLRALRALLPEPRSSTVAKWLAIEALAAMKSVDDAPQIAALATSRERLSGYWGERVQGKEDPTLGQRAKELASALK